LNILLLLEVAVVGKTLVSRVLPEVAEVEEQVGLGLVQDMRLLPVLLTQ
jgi:hypothetical protein